ncbi:unnamed protein product, partial [Musa acuminata subsp. burmannicoides]
SRLKAIRHGSGRDGRGATSFLLLRGGAELPSVSQGTILGGGRSVAGHQLREAADTSDDAGYDPGGGQLLGFGRELSAFGCISCVRGGNTRLESSREGSLLEQHHHDRVVFSASSDCGAIRQIVSFPFSGFLAASLGMVFEDLHVKIPSFCKRAKGSFFLPTSFRSHRC